MSIQDRPLNLVLSFALPHKVNFLLLTEVHYFTFSFRKKPSFLPLQHFQYTGNCFFFSLMYCLCFMAQPNKIELKKIRLLQLLLQLWTLISSAAALSCFLILYSVWGKLVAWCFGHNWKDQLKTQIRTFHLGLCETFIHQLFVYFSCPSVKVPKVIVWLLFVVAVVPCNDSVACSDGSTCCQKTSGDWACCPLKKVPPQHFVSIIISSSSPTLTHTELGLLPYIHLRDVWKVDSFNVYLMLKCVAHDCSASFGPPGCVLRWPSALLSSRHRLQPGSLYVWPENRRHRHALVQQGARLPDAGRQYQVRRVDVVSRNVHLLQDSERKLGLLPSASGTQGAVWRSMGKVPSWNSTAVSLPRSHEPFALDNKHTLLKVQGAIP